MNLMNNKNVYIERDNKNPFRRCLEKGELSIFFLLTYLLSWLFWTPALFKAYGIDLSLPEDALIIIGNFIPSILGLLLTGITLGGAGLKEIFYNSTRFRYPLRWYIYTVFLMPGILLSAYAISYFTRGLKFESILMPIIYPKVWSLIPLIIYFILLQGPAGEEFGWRGYALPKLLDRFKPLKASLIIGIIWTFWHLPKFFLIGSTQYTLTNAYGIILALVGYIIYTTMLSIMITLLYLKTRSIWAVLLFHAMSNFSHGLITILNYATGGISIILIMFIVTVFLIYRFRGLLWECEY